MLRNAQIAHMEVNLRSNIPQRGIFLRSKFSIVECAATGFVVGYKHTKFDDYLQHRSIADSREAPSERGRDSIFSFNSLIFMTSRGVPSLNMGAT